MKPHRHNAKGIVQSGFRQHASALRHALHDAIQHPVALWLAIFTIATALALPAGIFTLLSGLGEVTQSWDQGRTLNLYLEPGTRPQAAAKLSKQLQNRKDISNVKFISSQTAIQKLQTATGLSGIQDLLGDDALPAVLVITPSKPHQDSDSLDKLGAELGGLPHVREVQFDREWAKQTEDTLEVLRHFGLLVSILFAITVVLVVSGTLRMAVTARREEIEVTKLVGGNESYIQRPFLYTAFFLGFASSLLAIAMVNIGLSLIAPPLSQLVGLLSGNIDLNMGLENSLILLFFACLLSMISAWVAVHLQLKHIEPK
ncbi:MAG: cell division protein FtsX [bacterium]